MYIICTRIGVLNTHINFQKAFHGPLEIFHLEPVNASSRIALLGNCVEFAINCWYWLCIELLNVGNPVPYSQHERWVFSFSWMFVLFFYCRPSWVSSIMQINKRAIFITKAVILGTLVCVPGMCVQQISWRVFTQNWILQRLGVCYLLQLWMFMESRAGFWGDMHLTFKKKRLRTELSRTALSTTSIIICTANHGQRVHVYCRLKGLMLHCYYTSVAFICSLSLLRGFDWRCCFLSFVDPTVQHSHVTLLCYDFFSLCLSSDLFKRYVCFVASVLCNVMI